MFWKTQNDLCTFVKNIFMTVETVEDLANQICDWLGVYGACKHSTEEGCERSETKLMCCRVGFIMVLEERIRNSVHNEDKLQSIGFK
jgi:hypothetical protein